VEIRVADLEYTPESLSRVTRELVDGIGRLPGVTHVGLGDRLLSQTVTNVNPDGTIGTMTLTGEMGPGSARARQVSPSFFGALGLQVIRGRTFEEADSAVAVVNETFMQRLDDPGSVLGLAIPVRGGGTARIIGVVEAAYERAARGRPLPVVYAPRTEDSPFFSIFARAESARRLMPLVRRLMLDLDPRLAPFEIGTAGDLMRDAYAPLFGIAWALGVIGGLALLLAAVGLFGSVSQTTAQRLHEFGVRLALGARPLDIGRLIARETTVTSVAGTLLGLVFAVPILIGLIQTFGRQVLSLEAVGAVVAILAVVVFVASLFPARRAMRTDPMISLRSE
jgi:putative ABC transport system permease protein